MSGYTPTMGSLFSGIGGFELPAQWHGAKVLWQSEIEPWAVQLLQKRFPDAKQLGDITNISGSEIPPVDFITFGSPCQDMSVAGRRAGLDGDRSGLFRQAIRIIKEMREATNGEYPKFAIWENVPGAFTSNKGLDFKAVLEEIAETDIPMTASGRWANAGMVRGAGADISWRILDAQYWGVPQRRKRIYLVADYRSERSAEILFKSESMSRHPAPCGEPRQGSAGSAESGTGAAGNGIKAYRICSYASNCMKSDNPNSGIYETDKSSTLDLNGGNPACNQGGIMICVPIITMNERQYALTVSEDIANTLTSTDYKGVQLVGIPAANLAELMYIVRRLTPSECALLQGFPADWHEGIVNDKGKPMPDTAAYKGYGNAVATVCAEHPIAHIIEILKEENSK